MNTGEYLLKMTIYTLFNYISYFLYTFTYDNERVLKIFLIIRDTSINTFPLDLFNHGKLLIERYSLLRIKFSLSLQNWKKCSSCLKEILFRKPCCSLNKGVNLNQIHTFIFVLHHYMQLEFILRFLFSSFKESSFSRFRHPHDPMFDEFGEKHFVESSSALENCC